jgi:glyoxylate/hydroxypyruvate reductase
MAEWHSEFSDEFLLCAPLSAGPQLQTVSTMSVGLEHLDLGECARRHIPVGYTPDVLTNAVAELTVCLTLCTAKRIKEGKNRLQIPPLF